MLKRQDRADCSRFVSKNLNSNDSPVIDFTDFSLDVTPTTDSRHLRALSDRSESSDRRLHLHGSPAPIFLPRLGNSVTTATTPVTLAPAARKETADLPITWIAECY